MIHINMGEEYFDDLFEMTLINVINNWDLIQHEEIIIDAIKNDRLYTKLKKNNSMCCDQLIQANVLTYHMICKYLLSFPAN